MTLLPQLHAALKRVQPYVDLLPTGAAVEVLAAIERYEREQARGECHHASFAVVDGRCGSCGEVV